MPRASTLPGRMRQQTEIAIREADLIFFTIDAKSGLLPDDRTFAEIVRKSGKPVVLVANKAEAKGAQGGMLEAWELGLGEPIPVSAEHRPGHARSARRRDRSPLARSALSTQEEAEAEEEAAASEVPDRRGHHRIRMLKQPTMTTPSRCASPSSAVPMPASRR